MNNRESAYHEKIQEENQRKNAQKSKSYTKRTSGQDWKINLQKSNPQR